jgi:hypothetical protein
MYFKLGVTHITDLVGYDHILFIMVLCAAYSLTQWRNLLILITAFTIGHCTTLVLAINNYLTIRAEIIEFLIPVTILLTAIANILQKDELVKQKHQLFNYLMAMFFGLIHGLGFSNYLRSLLGSESNLVKPLFAFNLGIELGQLIIVAIIILITAVTVYFGHVKKREWNLILSGAGLGVSLILIIERYPF